MPTKTKTEIGEPSRTHKSVALTWTLPESRVFTSPSGERFEVTKVHVLWSFDSEGDDPDEDDDEPWMHCTATGYRLTKSGQRDGRSGGNMSVDGLPESFFGPYKRAAQAYQ